MRRAFAACLVYSLACALSPLSAAAHFGPAEPPDFGVPQCITLVDLRTTRELMLPYELAFDDVEPEAEKIMLEDSKTHQFFAFRGAVIPTLPRYYYWPFAPGTRAKLPMWLDRDDLQRADAANDPSIAPDFSAAVIGDDLLAVRPDVAGHFLEVSQKVPITIDQAMKGLRWDLTGAMPGVYQVIGYIFSPPYNAWEPRPGVIKLIDGSAEHGAVTVDSIDGMLYGGQGRRVTGCLDAPPGSTVSSWYSQETENEPEWHQWQKDMPIQSGKFDLCFSSPEPQLSGLIRLRIAVKTPAGLTTHAHSPDVLVLVSAPAACPPGDSKCCQPTAAMQPPPSTSQPAAAGASASQPMAAGSGAQPATAAAPAPAGTAAAPPPAAASGGCALAPRASHDLSGVLTWALALSLAVRSRRRRTRK